MKISASSVVLFLAGCAGLFIMARYLVAEHALQSFDEYMASTSAPAETSAQETDASADASEAPDANLADVEPFDGVPAKLLAQASIVAQAPKRALRLEIATTTAEQEQGLSGRAGLASGSGMVFVFPEPGTYPFWMKDMNFPIDMVWVDDSMTVVGVTAEVSPASYPSTFSPPSSIRYVVELASGAAAQAGLVEGARLVF